MIHGDNPFADDPALRDPVRRFRGRLAAPVTIVTSGSGPDCTGLTVSSLFVVEGEPGEIEMVVAPTTDLWDVSAASGRVVVHVCTEADRGLSDVFAGLRPNPGGVFAGLEVSESDWGPIIERLRNRASCTVIDRREAGYSGIVTARVDDVALDDLTQPLAYFRGSYRSVD